MNKKIVQEDKNIVQKKYRFREVSDEKRKQLLAEGWIPATKEEKQKHGNKKYMGTNMELMKKEV